MTVPSATLATHGSALDVPAASVRGRLRDLVVRPTVDHAVPPARGPAAQIDGAPVEPAALMGVALALAVVHLFAVRFVFDDGQPRRRIVSAGAGVSVAFVFVHVLPGIGGADRSMPAAGPILAALDRHAYLLAMVGFTTYYGLERFVRCSWLDGDTEECGDEPGPERPGGRRSGRPPTGVFWVHLGSFALYNALIGYLLVHRDEAGLASLATFAVALGVHFLVVDYGMRNRYPRRYHDAGRWLLAGAVVLGTGLGLATPVDEVTVDALFAFLGGGIVLNAINEELPEERRSDFWAFAAGGTVTALLLVAT